MTSSTNRIPEWTNVFMDQIIKHFEDGMENSMKRFEDSMENSMKPLRDRIDAVVTRMGERCESCSQAVVKRAVVKL
ncbi:hypothetical protein TKK_0010817 [Trichogramma kaykai]|uniref:Uncharacterized protein n=1 Tax=Trichogramma kaykai TaxID=54128 RepID=A0ABD2WUP2_9HYME